MPFAHLYLHTQKHFWFDIDLNGVTVAAYFGKLASEWNHLKKHNLQVPESTKSHGPLKFPVKKQKWMTATTTSCVYADDSDPFIKDLHQRGHLLQHCCQKEMAVMHCVYLGHSHLVCNHCFVVPALENI